MHDFCFTLPYGALVGVGGLAGYALKKSTPSLVGGLGAGGLLCAFGYGSLKSFKASGEQKRCSKLWSGLSLVVSTGLVFMMKKRYDDSGSLFPAAVIGPVSLAMSAFYVQKLVEKAPEKEA